MTLRAPERSRTPTASPHPPVHGKYASPRLARKILEAQQREQQLILAELVRIKGFMPLLMKRRNGGAWSHAERHELHEQLRAMAHLSPYLFILILPGSFVFLPMFAWWLDRRRHRRHFPQGH